MRIVICHGIFAAILCFPSAILATEAANKHSGPGVKAIKCRSNDFEAFINDFSEDVELQKVSIVYPLRSEYVDTEAEPDYKKVITYLKKGQIKFPVFLNSASRHEQYLEMKISYQNSWNAKVTLEKPDTDYLISYHFVKNKCWMLNRINDQSI